MIPGSFTYYRPRDISAALKILTEHGDEARVLVSDVHVDQLRGEVQVRHAVLAA